MEAAQKLISTRRGTIVLSVIAAAIAGGPISSSGGSALTV